MRSRRWAVIGAVAVVVLVAAACDFQGTWTAVTMPAPGGARSADDLQALSCLPSGQCVAAGISAALRTGSTWTDIASPPTAIADVACASITDCLGVAPAPAGSPSTPNAVYHYDGTSWATTSWPATDTPTAVSCGSSTLCMVVGRAGTSLVVRRWNGSTFSDTSVPDTSPIPFDVSCPTTTFCLAVGQATPGNNPWAASWSGGSTWATATTSGLTSFADLVHVSCATATFCETTNNDDFQIGTWNGTKLTGGPTSAPNADDIGYELIACPTSSASQCEASAGHIYDPDFTYEDTSVNVPGQAFVGVTDGQLHDLACTTATSCVALGQDGVTYGRAAWHFDGTSWTQDTFATVHADTQATSLSCPTSSFCMMGGSYADGGSREPYAQRWNGSTWTTTPPLPAGSAEDVQAACLSATDCIASVSGIYGTDALDTWNGTSWTQRTTTDGGGVVACTGPSFCLAATQGRYWTWNGTSLSGPVSYGPDLPPGSISCSSATHCVLATGYDPDSPFLFDWQSQLVTWNGTTMSAPVNAPAPVGEYAQLASVSCPSGAPCRAVGTVGAVGGTAASPYVLEGDGTSWSSVTVPATGPGWLTNVSCPNSGECLAVGAGTVKGSTDPGLALAESGVGSWFQAPDLPRSGSAPVAYDRISCVSLWCTAVGAYADNGHPTITSAHYTWTDTSS
jgi:hypothetical protein